MACLIALASLTARQVAIFLFTEGAIICGFLVILDVVREREKKRKEKAEQPRAPVGKLLADLKQEVQLRQQGREWERERKEQTQKLSTPDSET